MIKREKKTISQSNRRHILIIVFSFIFVCLTFIIVSGESYKKYLNQDERTTCIKTTDYGKEGNEEGCLIHYKTLTSNYTLRYGLQYEESHMKDKESADQKYLALKSNIEKMSLRTNEEKIISNLIRVSAFCDNQDQVYYIVQADNDVYFAKGSLANKDRNKRWFELIQVDYKVS